MITRKQIEKYCGKKMLSNKLWATLNHDYKVEDEKYIIPAGTIVQVKLYRIVLADLCINGECITYTFPYDAATLLETEE